MSAPLDIVACLLDRAVFERVGGLVSALSPLFAKVCAALEAYYTATGRSTALHSGLHSCVSAYSNDPDVQKVLTGATQPGFRDDAGPWLSFASLRCSASGFASAPLYT